MRGQIVKITNKQNLELGKPNECHANAAIYAIENDCDFVCGWLMYEDTTYKTPHCICCKDGEYIDPTLNRESEFKIFHVYTAEEICSIFDEEGEAFIPFQGNYKVVYDGMKKVEPDDLEEWWNYVCKINLN